jgi:hypothetical protein
MAVLSQGVSDIVPDPELHKSERWKTYQFFKSLASTGTLICKNSKKYLSLLKLIESSTEQSTKIDHPTTYLSAQFLYGAEIQKHTDSEPV